MSKYTGEIRIHGGSAIPNGWLLCDGSILNISDYPALFSVLGITFGGNGSTTFGIPDLRNRTVIGVGTGVGLTARSLADTGGVETYQLSDAELPDHDHAFNVTTANRGSLGTPNDTVSYGDSGGGLAYSTALTSTVPFATEAIGYNGASSTKTAHNNLQPFQALNFIISVSDTDGALVSDSLQFGLDKADTSTVSDSLASVVYISLNDSVGVADTITNDAQLTLDDSTDIADNISLGLFLNDSTYIADNSTVNAQLSLSDDTSVSDDKVVDALLILDDDTDITDNKTTNAQFELSDDTSIFDDDITFIIDIALSDSTSITDGKIANTQLLLSDGTSVSDKITSLSFYLNDKALASDTVLSTELPGNLFEVYAQADNGAVDLVINLVEDDQLPVLVFSVLDSDNTLYNLTGATVQLLVRERDALPGDFKINQPMDILPSGLVRYQLQANDTDTPGEYYAEIEITFSGIRMTSQQFLIRIREQL